MKNSINISILGDSSTQFYSKYLKESLKEQNIVSNIYEGDFGNIDHEIIDKASKFYRSNPDIVILFNSYQSLYKEFISCEREDRSTFYQKILSRFENRINAIDKNMIIFNYPEVSERLLGNNDNRFKESFLYQLRNINNGIIELSLEHEGIDILDISLLSAEFGYKNVFDKRFYYSFNQVFSRDFTKTIAEHTARIISSDMGNIIKIIITDLDNTLWGGIVGEDGIENIHIGELGVGHIFSDIQKFLKKLVSTGILLAVVSKNDEKIAKEAFIEHPDMPLDLQDIIIFKANWEPKSQNIKDILDQLNISSKNALFLDDNIREREEVRERFSDMCIIELPEDPAFYLDTIKESMLTQRGIPTKEDVKRNSIYKQRINRETSSQKFSNIDEFLEHLNMRSEVFVDDEFMIPRISQLTQRTNQFNLRTIRYDSSDIKRFCEDDSYHVFSYSLQDIFGDNGTVGVIIVKEDEKKWFIDTFLLSCRVFKKTVEHFMINDTIERAKGSKVDVIIGEYIDSGRNSYVKDIFRDLGFKKIRNKWVVNIEDWKPLKTYVK